jgi:hypothetical protein
MQKEWRTGRKKFLLSTMVDEVKVTVFRKNQMWDQKLAYKLQILVFGYL